MVNVRVEYPESYKVIYENLKPIHREQDVIIKINKKHNRIKWEEEPIVNCPNKEVEITGLTNGVVTKIPVILAVFTVRININSLIEFSEPIFEIKEMIKRVNINKCTLVQNTNTIFIKGFIKKDIRFYTGSSLKDGEAYGEVQEVTVEVPFNCTTLIKYNIMKPEEIRKSNIEEFKYNINHGNIRYDTEYYEKAMGQILYEDSNCINQVVTEYYNEAPYCEVVSSEIVETERLRSNAIEGEGILNITIRVLQKKLVYVPKTIINE